MSTILTPTDHLFCPPPKSFPVTLGGVTFYVQRYQVTGQRIFAEQSAADGTTHLTNQAKRARRITLDGTWVTDESPAALILLLDGCLERNEAFSLTLGSLHYVQCRIARYTAAEESLSPLLTGRLELLTTQPPQEVTAHA